MYFIGKIIGFAVIMFLQVKGFSCSIVDGLLLPVVETGIDVLGDLAPVTVSLTKDFQSIEIRPLNAIGYIGLPLNLLCKTPLLNLYATCFVCNSDCVFVHNTFGGKLVDDTFKTVLVARMEGLQCVQYNNGSYEPSGCSTDCDVNHGSVNGGYCDITPPRDSELGTEPTLHCECNDS